MPTEMRTASAMFNERSGSIHHSSLNIRFGAHLSVHLCDYCPLLRLLRDGETGYYFLMPNRSITAR